MSLAKAVPKSLKDCKCKKIAFEKVPSDSLCPWVFRRGGFCLQGQPSNITDQERCGTFSTNLALQEAQSISHSLGICARGNQEKGYFKAHKDANKAYVEQHNLVMQVKAHLAKLDKTTSKGTGLYKDSTKKPKETAVAASQAHPALQAEYMSDIKQAQDTAEKVKANGEQAAADMFQLYANLLPINTKYLWNKINHKQMASDSYLDLQGCSMKGPRGFLHKSINDCVMFHLLIVFPNNAAEQEQYYITNVLKKPQHISVHQFVQFVEQLNSYIVQLPCWFHSTNAKTSMVPMNVPFAEADLASHVLWMYPHT